MEDAVAGRLRTFVAAFTILTAFVVVTAAQGTCDTHER